MAKDDYFVVAYRVLKYLYGCFRAGERADLEDNGRMKKAAEFLRAVKETVPGF